jgi:hypothetical protein
MQEPNACVVQSVRKIALITATRTIGISKLLFISIKLWSETDDGPELQL